MWALFICASLYSLAARTCDALTQDLFDATDVRLKDLEVLGCIEIPVRLPLKPEAFKTRELL
jgi:hypothetical protein